MTTQTPVPIDFRSRRNAWTKEVSDTPTTGVPTPGYVWTVNISCVPHSWAQA